MASSTDLVSGICFVSRSGPGLRRLGTFSISVVSGTPSVLIVPNTALTHTQYTAFGTTCPTADGDYTMVLGKEWFDADGLLYGGWPDPPHLSQPAAMSVDENATADQAVTATDPDGGTITVSRMAGPAYMTVQPNGSGASSTWGVHLAPGYFDAGDSIGRIQASDGIGKDLRSFAIHVRNVNRAPELDVPPSVSAVAGQLRRGDWWS